MSDLKRLVAKHAEYSDLKACLKRKIRVEISKHEYSKKFEDVLCGDDKLSHQDLIYGACGYHAYKAVKVLNRDNQDCYSYDEVLQNYGCDHCIAARKIKLKMNVVGAKLGQIRGAITRVGQKLNREHKHEC